MKTKQDNNVTNRTGAIHVKLETELSSLIKPSVVYDENQVGQQHHRLYKCTFIVKMILNICDQLD